MRQVTKGLIQRRQFLQAAGAGAGAGACACWGTRTVLAAEKGESYEWQSLPFAGGGPVGGLVFHPTEPGLLYARTERGGAHRWDAAAKAWVPMLDRLGAPDADLASVLSLAIDPRDPERVYLACGSGTGEWSRKAALLASSDRGATWQQHELDLRLGGGEAGRGSGERLQVDPNHGEVLLLGTTQDGLQRSEDRGRSFRSASSPGKRISLVLFEAASGTPGSPSKTFYVGCQDAPGLHATRDGGKTFAREPGTPAQVPQRAVFGPDGTLYVSFAISGNAQAPNPGNLREGSVWKRATGGQWQDITPLKPAGRSHGYGALDVDGHGRIVSSMLLESWDGPGDELFLSVDGGAHWKPLSARSQHDVQGVAWLGDHQQGAEAMGHGIGDAKFDPHAPDRLVYAFQYGLWETAGLGAAAGPEGNLRWTFAAKGLELASALSLASPSGGVLLFAAMDDGLGGAAWEDPAKAPENGLFRPSRETTRCVDVSWQAPSIVARTVDAGTGGYVSVDGGASWRPFGAQSLAKDARGGRVAVSAKGVTVVWAPPRQPAMFSRDRGRSWNPCKGWPQTDAELAPVADKFIDGVFYVHDMAKGTVLVSVDGGASFAATLVGLPNLEPWQRSQLVAAPGAVRDLWIAMPQGLLHVPGLDERPKTLRSVAEARLVALGKAAPGAAYHSVYVWGRVGIGGAEPADGLFRSDDAGNSFRRIDDERHRYGGLQALAADPLSHGTVFLAPRGRGVVVGKVAA